MGVTATTVGAGSRLRQWLESLERAIRVVHRIIGVPDYDGYVAHHRTCHAGEQPLSRDEFTKLRLAERYSRPGARCC